jgi:hypothetical protein
LRYGGDPRPGLFQLLHLGGGQQRIQDAGEVVAHGAPGGVGRALTEGLQHNGMLVDPGDHSGGVGLDAEGLGLGRPGPGVPKGLDRVDHGAVAGGGGDQHVEAPVGVLRHQDVAVVLGLHLFDEPLEFIELFVGYQQGGERTRLAFDGAAGFQQLEGAHVHLAGLTVPGQAGHHIDPGAQADIDQPVQLQGDDRLADGRAGDRIGLGQVALGG